MMIRTIFKILLLAFLSTSIQANEFNLDAIMSYQRGNTFDTVLGSNVGFKTDRISTSILYLYNDNDVKIDRKYEAKGNADYPIYGNFETFTFATIGMDSKKNLDNYNKSVVGLSYRIFNMKYSIGIGRNQENDNHVFVTTHRFKTNYENEFCEFDTVAWYIKNPDDYDVSLDASIKLKITEILRVGFSIEYSYDSSPIGDSIHNDFLSKFIVGVKLK